MPTAAPLDPMHRNDSNYRPGRLYCGLANYAVLCYILIVLSPENVLTFLPSLIREHVDISWSHFYLNSATWRNDNVPTLCSIVTWFEHRLGQQLLLAGVGQYLLSGYELFLTHPFQLISNLTIRWGIRLSVDGWGTMLWVLEDIIGE
jgi:hypothetical protein